ncbi:CMP-N-acetylneuraminate-beta-galactosamide-alpha-2,3-sialyltransferase [Caballeronia calidae]|uniref:CMP-N-acetylneuraminate-beta-galactosamide-alpha-2,3-sialyltransferase n=1 Tax=Caballeronia calidae TaxID=1777139 RepID=A0A158BYV6_9BURK|nr:glycosyltransferase family 52 [Caballeronia calidae]SAK75289.1 CMP-N-acetylneuraminate-beta-galactosamide-alpha-2,3-sialyltransferase [Caballeronia calidae]
MNLLICYTPLHVLIAERLVALGELGEFYLLYICFNDSDRHDFYFRRLAESATYGGELLRLPHDWRDPFVIARWRVRQMPLKPRTLFCGNIKHAHSRWAAYLFGIKQFKTFDDGSGNIASSGYFYDMSESAAGKTLFSTLAPRYLYRNVIRKIDVHFSIYEEPNVYSKFARQTRRIPLLINQRFSREPGEGKVTVYVGHALVEDALKSREEGERLDRAVFRKYGVDHFLPHPRSANLSFYAPLRDVAETTPLVAEEFVLGLLEQYANVRVIGFKSSALLNLAFVPGVDVINLNANDAVEQASSLSIAMQARKIRTVTESELLSDYEKTDA